MDVNIWFWIGFNAFVLALLAIDLGVFHRKAHAVGTKEAAIWTVVWISLALLFNAGLFLFEGRQSGMMFLAGYLIEKSLSVDNIFVFVMLFSYFSVPAAYQHRVLFWGILGALLLRGTLIGVGAFLISQFSWILYIFGGFLVFTGIRMALHKEDDDLDIEGNAVVRLLRRFVPMTSRYRGDRFFVRNGAAAEMLRAMRSFLGENDMMAYLAMMAVRLIELHRVLKSTGSLYLHCDPTASHYLKILLDAVFGARRFGAEIVWKRTSMSFLG